MRKQIPRSRDARVIKTRPQLGLAAVAAAIAATAALLPSSLAAPVPPHGVAAALLEVEQLGFENPPENISITTPVVVNDFRVRSTANRGDYDVQIGDDMTDDVPGGILIPSIAESGRDHFDPVYPGVNFATAHIHAQAAGSYFIPVAMTWPNANSTAVIEYNLNVAAAWFPYDQWIGGLAVNATGANGGANDTFFGTAGLELGTHFIDNGSGRSVVDLRSLGIDSREDGVLLVVGAKNEDNYALSQVTDDGTWNIFSKDNGTDGTSLEQDPIGFVFVPKTNTLVVSGRFLGNAEITHHSGETPAFTITTLDVGTWELLIPGWSPRNGVLIISPEGGSPGNRDNIVNYRINDDGTGWIIESRDLPSTFPLPETPGDGTEAVASFVFIPGALPGISIDPAENLFTTENGATTTFNVVLDTAPAADVTVSLSSSNPAEGIASPETLTFTAGDWNVPQAVTVTGVDDEATDGAVAYSIVLSVEASGDPEYEALADVVASVTNLDNEGGLTVNPTAGLTVTEAGGTATFTVRLNTAPTAEVTVNLSSSDPSEGTVSPETLTFDTSTWDQEMTVTVTGVDDSVDDGEAAFTIVTAPVVSTDPFYNGRNPADVSVTNTDDDATGITVSPETPLAVVETGGTAQFTVVLNSEPTANVTVSLASTDTAEGTVAPATLVFTPANWNTPQAATVSAVDDLVVDGNATYTITTTAASDDPLYAAFDVADVTVTTLDDEGALTLPVEVLNYGIGMPGTGIAGQATLVDPYTINYDGGTLSVSLTGGTSDDRLEVRPGGEITVSDNNVSFGGVGFASFTGGTGTTPLVFTLNNHTTAQMIEGLIRAVTYRNVNEETPRGNRTVNFTLTDRDQGVSTASRAVSLGTLRTFDFQQGADHGWGIYTGAADLELYELNPTSAYPSGHAASGLWIDWRDPDSPNSGHVLLRFDDIIGDGPGQIPANAIIVSADLYLDINDSGDFSPLHRMMVDWDPENETWDSIGGGAFPDDARVRWNYDSQIGVENGTGATTLGTIHVSVTPDVQAWVSGAEPNYGWAMPGWPLNLDGTGFSPSEAPVVSDRPRLRVHWLPADSVDMASFRWGVNDYTAAYDTRIRQNAPDTEYSLVGSVLVDSLVSEGDPNPEQVLLQFKEIFGTGPGQVPPGSYIHAAILDLASVQGNAMGDGGTFHALLQPWEDVTSTWNFWVDGIQTNGVEAAVSPTAAAGNPTLNPDAQGGYLSFDLTSDVQAWSSGTMENNGWVIMPWENGSNGWGFTTSETADERNRPQLRVYYSEGGVVPVQIELDQPVVTENSTQLTFNADPNATYSVLRATSIDGDWTDIGDATTNASGVGTYTDSNPPAEAAFYRISSP